MEKQMIRKIAYNTTLGINGKTFKLTKNDEIQTFEKDSYGRIKTIIQNQTLWINHSTIERICQ